jgi:predicted acetyltransferase
LRLDFENYRVLGVSYENSEHKNLSTFPSKTGNLLVFSEITGHKDVESLQEAERSGLIEMFTGQSLEVSDQDQVFSCVADSRGLLSSVGLPQAGKDVTIILHLQEPAEAKKGLGKEEKRKKLKAKINKAQAELDRLTGELKSLAED